MFAVTYHVKDKATGLKWRNSICHLVAEVFLFVLFIGPDFLIST